jgi:hypothetical protein
MQVGHVSFMRNFRNVSNILVRNQRKRPLGRTVSKLEDIIKMDLREIECKWGLDWTGTQ